MAAYSIDAEIERLEALVRDLRVLRTGGQPALELLASAPFIDCWGWMPVQAFAMCGIVYGHPKIEDGRGVTTSLVWIDGHHDGWVRTRSRLYRVGDAMSDLVEDTKAALATEGAKQRK